MSSAVDIAEVVRGRGNTSSAVMQQRREPLP